MLDASTGRRTPGMSDADWDAIVEETARGVISIGGGAPIGKDALVRKLLDVDGVSDADIAEAVAHVDRNTPAYQKAREQMDTVTEAMNIALRAILVALPPLDDSGNDGTDVSN